MLVVIQLIIKNLLQMRWRTETMLQHSPLILELYAEYHLRNFIEIGKNNRQHSPCISRYGTERDVAKAVLIGAIPPLLLKTAANLDDHPLGKVSDQLSRRYSHQGHSPHPQAAR
jgi:hypothetical protein